ncbi:MAG TPA: serine/threonine-protein kinase [Kofleriaceae bacterium]|jgi:serine/threonine-protein kinase|nr:serine/threonine-protein kinase [Kofleriaceae bacterium]
MAERFGDWQLDALVAVGGLGEVWRALCLKNVAPLRALKRLHTHLARNDEARRQFAVEQRLAVELPRHPNVVHGIDAGAIDDRPYVALELAPGTDLRRVLAPPATGPGPAKRVALARARALATVAAACDAVAHLHEHGWIHGDVNPGNLVVDADSVVLVDLGIARHAGEAGAVRGTHAYMAPEQVRGEAWTPATDVFALGVVLWELIADARLFHRGPTWLSMAAVVEDAVPALADPALDAIAQAALAKAPSRRLASARELAAQLRAIAA